MKNFLNKIKTFVVSHKVVSITSACVVALAILTGVTVGILTNKNNKVESKPKTDTSSASSVVSSEEVLSSEEPVVSSEEAVSSEEPVESQAPVVSQISEPKQSTTSSKTTASSTPQQGAVVIGGGNFANGTGTWLPSGWVCPDKTAHAGGCLNQSEHDAAVERQKKQDERNANATRDPDEIGKICYRCHKPWGDGYNGTCKSYFDETQGCYVCQHFD